MAPEGLRAWPRCASGVVPQQPPITAAPASSSLGDDRPEVGGLRRVDEAALQALRQAGVGHHRAGRLALAGGPELASASRQARGPTPQLTPTASTPAPVSAARASAGRRPVGEHQVLAERHRRDQRHVGRTPGLLDGEQQVVEVEEGLDDQEVDAALEEPVDLLAVHRADRGVVRVAQLARGRAERADAAADPRVAAADVAGLAGDLGRPAVEAPGLGGRARTRPGAAGWPRT